MRLAVRASLRHARRHPWQLLLATLGAALGVAVVTAIDLTEAAARHAFDDATAAVTGRATHHLLGGPRGLDEALYVELRTARDPLRDADLAPVVEGTVALPGRDGAGLRLLGIDPIVEGPFRRAWSAAPGGGTDLRAFLTEPGTVFATPAAARRLGVAAGATLDVVHEGRHARLRVLDVLAPGRDGQALAATELLIADLATAQEALGMPGRLSRIDALADARQAAALARAAGARVEVVPAQARSRALQGMTRAFHTNLRALSLLALMVGMFLVYNAQSFLVVQRRVQFGILRALGVSRRALAAIVLGEAALLGAVGAAAGLLLGSALARVLVGLVLRTINDLYYPLAVATLVPDAGVLARAALLGLGGALAAALAPALEAARVPPRAALSRADLERRAARAARRAALAGLALGAAGLALFAAPGPPVTLGFAGLFCIVLGFALASPLALVGAIALLLRVPAARRRLALRLGARGVVAALSRTGVAVAALMLAVATTIGIGVMVASFRASVSDWLGQLLRADYYVSAPGAGEAPLPPALVERLRAQPGVAWVSHVRRARLPAVACDAAAPGCDTAAAEIQVAAYDLPPPAFAAFRLRGAPDPAAFWAAFQAGEAVMVSEPYAWHHGTRVGDTVRLRTDDGPRHFPVGAIYQDYASDRGIVALGRAAWERHWREPGITGIGLYAGPGFDAARLRRDLAGLADGMTLELAANAELRAASLAVFDRTFTITEVLRLLAGVIAFTGVLGALLAIELERGRELAVLRALGMRADEIRRVILAGTGLLGAVAGLLAIPAGLAMAASLVYVVNRRSFGWSMQLHAEPGILAAGVALALVAALAAGLYPAARMARIPPAAALRSE